MVIVEYTELITDTIRHICASDSLCGIAHEQIVKQMEYDAPVAFDMLKELGQLSVLFGMAVAAILLIISFSLLKFRIGAKFLRLLFIFSWFFSFAVYDVGMCIDNQCLTLLTNAPMAMLHAFGSFLLSSDVSEIHTRFYESTSFMALFSASHAISAFVSALFIIKVFGFNIVQRIRLYFERIKLTKRRETYVFWGCNSITYKLVESIKEQYGADKEAYRIVVIKTANDVDDSSDSAIGFNRIFEILKLKNSELERLQNLGCFIVSSLRCNLNTLSEYSANRTDNIYDILSKELRLKSLAKILTSKTTEKIHFLFLSDDEKQNLHDVSVILKDSTLNSFANTKDSDVSKNRKVILYCHARFNGVHRVIEDKNYSNNLEVKVIDSSHINVELLKYNDDVLPVNFVEVEADATVSSAFNAMVIGFSEVGQDATRFLYEFGAFVKSGGDNDHAIRSDFHLDVIDKNMKDKAGLFVANAPAIRPSLSFIPELKNPDALIELHNDDCCSVEFYKKLEEKIKTLNYVVIATEDDELNMSMGIRIFRAATRYRDNLDRLCILIRIHNDDDGHFSKIAGYYNKLWASQDGNNLQGKNPNRRFKKTDRCILPLYIFGHDEDVYTYSNIIGDSILKRAIRFKERYESSTNKKYNSPDNEEDYVWYKDIEKLLHTNDEYHPAYACLMRLRRTQGQDIANSLHWRTKELLRDKAMARNNIFDFQWPSLQRYDKQTDYSSVSGVAIDPRIVRFLTVMAQTEHLRWNASHEILGYVFDKNGKNEIRLRHDCLTDWANLNEETRSYDNNVVDITFGIIDPKNKIMTNDKK